MPNDEFQIDPGLPIPGTNHMQVVAARQTVMLELLDRMNIGDSVLVDWKYSNPVKSLQGYFAKGKIKRPYKIVYRSIEPNKKFRMWKVEKDA